MSAAAEEYAEGGEEYYEEGGEEEDYEEGGEENAELEDMKRQMAEMDAEAEALDQMQSQVEGQIGSASEALDENSVFVGEVDYASTPEELRVHFAPCGTIKKITIICDKITGAPKGFAYVKFADQAGVDNALKLNGTAFKGRNLKVIPKRQNEPSFKRGGGRGGRGRGGRGGFRGGFRGGRGGGYRGGGRGGGFRGGRGGGFRGRGGGGGYRGRGGYQYQGY